MTDHEREMERLAERLASLNRFDAVPTTIPTTGDDQDTEPKE